MTRSSEDDKTYLIAVTNAHIGEALDTATRQIGQDTHTGAGDPARQPSGSPFARFAAVLRRLLRRRRR